MFQKYMERDFHSASHPTSRICMLFFVGLWIAQNPRYSSVIPHRNQPGSITSYVTMHLVQRVQLSLLVGPTGIEPVTRGFSVLCYYLLSYGPIYETLILCKLLGSNQRPIVYQTIAHPAELNSLQVVDLLNTSLWLRRLGLEPRISSL